MTANTAVQEAFELDTSGTVRVRRLYDGPDSDYLYRWSDLTPFTQGAIREALASSVDHAGTMVSDDQMMFVAPAFSDLAPETLARIVEDCERMSARIVHSGYPAGEAEGSKFQRLRQLGAHEDFPPLTLYLADDGLIRFREVEA